MIFSKESSEVFNRTTSFFRGPVDVVPTLKDSLVLLPIWLNKSDVKNVLAVTVRSTVNKAMCLLKPKQPCKARNKLSPCNWGVN